MAQSRKTIITCAVTGSIHTPSMTPYLPITPQEIAAESIAAAEAGAAIIHLHARDPKDGRPSPDVELFKAFLPQIKQSTDAVINLTTGGGHNMSVEQRLSAPISLAPEMCSMNMGSMNFGLYEMLDRYQSFKHEWERPYLEGSEDRVFRNTFRDIANILTSCARNQTRFELECYDIGHLYTAQHFLNRQLVEPPLFIQSVFGLRGGIGAHMSDVIHMHDTAQRLFGTQYFWSVLGAGASQMRVAMQAVLLGGNVRVGLEDSLWLGKGRLAESNAQQVRKIRHLIEELGGEIASPDEARQMLALKGRHAVAF